MYYHFGLALCMKFHTLECARMLDEARTYGHALDIVSRGLLMNQFIELARAATARMDYIEAASMWMGATNFSEIPPRSDMAYESGLAIAQGRYQLGNYIAAMTEAMLTLDLKPGTFLQASTTGKGSVGRLARRTSRHLALSTLYANSLFAMGHEAEAQRLLTPLSQLDGFADLAQQERAVVQALNALRRVERYDSAHSVVARPVHATSHAVVGAIDELRTAQRRFQGVLPATLNLRMVVVAARLTALYLPSTELQSLEDGVTAAGSSCSASSRADEELEWQGDVALTRGSSRSARDSYAAALRHLFDRKAPPSARAAWRIACKHDATTPGCPVVGDPPCAATTHADSGDHSEQVWRALGVLPARAVDGDGGAPMCRGIGGEPVPSASLLKKYRDVITAEVLPPLPGGESAEPATISLGPHVGEAANWCTAMNTHAVLHAAWRRVLAQCQYVEPW